MSTLSFALGLLVGSIVVGVLWLRFTLKVARGMVVILNDAAIERLCAGLSSDDAHQLRLNMAEMRVVVAKFWPRHGQATG